MLLERRQLRRSSLTAIQAHSPLRRMVWSGRLMDLSIEGPIRLGNEPMTSVSLRQDTARPRRLGILGRHTCQGGNLQWKWMSSRASYRTTSEFGGRFLQQPE